MIHNLAYYRQAKFTAEDWLKVLAGPGRDLGERLAALDGSWSPA